MKVSTFKHPTLRGRLRLKLYQFYTTLLSTRFACVGLRFALLLFYYIKFYYINIMFYASSKYTLKLPPNVGVLAAASVKAINLTSPDQISVTLPALPPLNNTG